MGFYQAGRVLRCGQYCQANRGFRYHQENLSGHRVRVIRCPQSDLDVHLDLGLRPVRLHLSNLKQKNTMKKKLTTQFCDVDT